MASRKHIFVSGHVQGVWYRGSCARQATALGISGWARNLPDGRVEVVAEGEPAALAALERWCGQGPPAAHVERVEARDEPPEGLSGFTTQ